MSRRAAGAAAALVALAVALALAVGGCGGASADLFAVQRTGSAPGARLSMVVNDAGTVRCNGRKPVDIADADLLDARQLTRDLASMAKRHLVLAARPGSVFAYSVRTADGSIRFADTSRPLRPALQRLSLLVLKLARSDCHLSH